MSHPPDSDARPDEAAADAVDVFGDLVCTNTSLRRAARQLGLLYDDAVAPLALKATQFGLLAQIHNLGGADGPTLQALADRLAIRISALTHALRPLLRDGLVELRPDAHDRRTKHAALTPLGLSRLEEGVALWAAANRRVELVLGPAAGQLRALADLVSSRAFFDAYKAGRPVGGS